MAIKWTMLLILFFQREDSCGWVDEQYLQRTASLSIKRKPYCSTKALVWIAIFILTGLVIGQLC